MPWNCPHPSTQPVWMSIRLGGTLKIILSSFFLERKGKTKATPAWEGLRAQKTSQVPTTPCSPSSPPCRFHLTLDFSPSDSPGLIYFSAPVQSFDILSVLRTRTTLHMSSRPFFSGSTKWAFLSPISKSSHNTSNQEESCCWRQFFHCLIQSGLTL